MNKLSREINDINKSKVFWDNMRYSIELTKDQVRFIGIGELWVINQQLEQLDYEKKEVAEKFEAICNKISRLEDRKLDLENEVEGK